MERVATARIPVQFHEFGWLSIVVVVMWWWAAVSVTVFPASAIAADLDTDRDGLADAREQAFQSSPYLADTDGGGLSDAAEAARLLNPLDPDDDDDDIRIFSIPLTAGSNMISLPFQPLDARPEILTGGIQANLISIMSYHQGKWKSYNPREPDFNDLESMAPGVGYWVKMSGAATLTVTGTIPSGTTTLVAGQNMVGYASLARRDIRDALGSAFSGLNSIWIFQNGYWATFNALDDNFSDFSMLEPGRGYFFVMNKAASWSLK